MKIGKTWNQSEKDMEEKTMPMQTGYMSKRFKQLNKKQQMQL